MIITVPAFLKYFKSYPEAWHIKLEFKQNRVKIAWSKTNVLNKMPTNIFKDIMKFFFSLYPLVAVYVIGMVYLPKEYIYKKFRISRALKKSDTPQQDGKYAIITGGTSGIGLAVVQKLLSLGMNVIVGSRPCPQGSASIQEFQRKYPNLTLENWSLDLCSMESVKQFAELFMEKGYPLHLLILNAGIMFAPFEITEDGFEKHFSVNYLGHCLLTKLLLEQLKRSGTCSSYARIVYVSSSCHFVGKINFDDLQSWKSYSPYHCYSQSKVAGVMFTHSLQQILDSQNSHITINCLHPGVVYTGLYQHVWWVNSWIGLLFKTPEEGAEIVLFAALSPEMERLGGKYLEECSICNPSVYSTNKKCQDHLWEVTWELLNPWLNKSSDIQ